jgi:hypothetical protein
MWQGWAGGVGHYIVPRWTEEGSRVCGWRIQASDASQIHLEVLWGMRLEMLLLMGLQHGKTNPMHEHISSQDHVRDGSNE